jgi:osmotically inducible protein OsmC
MTPENIHTIATLAFEKLEGGWTISGVHLDTTARIPNADPQAFEQAAERAKEICPISRALKANITLAAKLGA